MKVYIVFLFVNFLLLSTCPETMDVVFMLTAVIWSFFSILFFFRMGLEKGIRKIYIRHSTMYVLIFVIVFYQKIIDYILGFVDGEETVLWISETIVAKSLIISNISLNCFFIGYSFNKQIRHVGYTNMMRSYSYKRSLCGFAYLLMALFLIFVDKSFLIGGYQDGQLDRAFSLLIVLQAVIISVLVLYSIEYKEAPIKKKLFVFFKYPFFLISFYCVLVILCGRRTEVVRVLSMLIICLIYIKGRDTNFKKMCAVGLFFILVFGLVGILRGEDSEGVSSSLNEMSQRLSISPATSELATSVNTLHVAVYNVPNEIPYNMGLSFFLSFAIVVPGLDRLVGIFLPPTITNSAAIITYLYWGSDPPYGMGSSIVADVYLSFGLIGIVIVFILLGRFFRFLEIQTFINKDVSPYILALSFCVFSQITYAMRTGVSVLLLSWTYSCILIYIVTVLSKKKIKNRPLGN